MSTLHAMFKRIFIAQRSVSRMRVTKTCRRLGITSVTFGNEGDSWGDEMTPVVEKDGSLDLDALIAVAAEKECDAIHPGFLDDHGDGALAELLEESEVTLLGVQKRVLELISDAESLVSLSEEAVVRMPPRRPVADVKAAVEAARDIRFPVRLRNGGFEAPLVDTEALYDAWEKQSPHDNVVVEAFYPRSSSVEVIVAADQHGTVEPLVEVERTLRQVHEDRQYVLLEETPAPALSFRNDGESIRALMFEHASRVAKAVGAVGLVRVRFLLTPEGKVFVTAVRLGIPSMHAPIEKVTKLDLVELQLRLAAGESVPDELLVLQPFGCAIGARVVVTGEGIAKELHVPPAPLRNVLVEWSSTPGEAIAVDDGNLLLRLTCFSPVRHHAAMMLRRLLVGARFDVETNRELLVDLLNDERFRAGRYDETVVPRLSQSA